MTQSAESDPVPHLFERDRSKVHVCTCGRAYAHGCHEPFRPYEPREHTESARGFDALVAHERAKVDKSEAYWAGRDDLAEATGYRDTVTGRLVDEPRRRREVIHDSWCGVPTGRTWACACNERNGYRVTPPGQPADDRNEAGNDQG